MRRRDSSSGRTERRANLGRTIDKNTPRKRADVSTSSLVRTYQKEVERQKLVAGLLKACEKRPVSVAALEAIADRVESTLQERAEKEITTNEVGSFVMQELKKLDKVAYVRFASVYRHFRDIGEFMTELKDLLNAKE